MGIGPQRGSLNVGQPGRRGVLSSYGLWERLTTFQMLWTFGKRWRRPDYTHGGYQYMTERQRARHELAKQCDPDHPVERTIEPTSPGIEGSRRARI